MSAGIRDSAEKISQSFYDWLKAEVVTSGESRNRYLDNFDEVRRRMALPYDDDDNWNSQKDKSHQQRLPGWLQTYELSSAGDSEAEFCSARVLFAPLMSISGAYRSECYLKAQDQEEYIKLRSQAIGVDLEQTAFYHLRENMPDGNFSKAELSIEALKNRFYQTYSKGEARIREMNDGLLIGYGIGESNSKSVQEMHRTQYDHTRLAIDCLIMAAKLRKGDVKAAPFLEPVSISDQSGKTHYPLKSPVNWAEVLAA